MAAQLGTAFLSIPAEIVPSLQSAQLSSSSSLRGRNLRSLDSTLPASTDEVSSLFPTVLSAGALGIAAGVASKRRQRQSKPKSKITLQAVAMLTPKLKEVDGGLHEREDIRNIAIIAHVDHGKTTLTDSLMKQCGKASKGSMDSNQLEMERGITILAKNAAVKYKDIKINLVDTPGHADFGGEVERILNMADACILLVDAQEGPMPQTKFVLRQALKLQRRIIVCINKVDKPASRPDWVLDTTFDLFASLGANDEICDFPVVYASGFHGVASREAADKLEKDLTPLLDVILEECPKPVIDTKAPLQMLVTNLDYDDYIGRICIGRLTSGSIRVGQEVGFMYGADGALRTSTVSKLWHFSNNEKEEIDEVSAGDICAFSGMNDVKIGDTVVDAKDPKPMPPIVVEEPTVVMEIGVNKSPLGGQTKGGKFTAAMIKARLEKETLTNLALRMEPGSSAESFRVKGRGTLQLGILMENMRRENFEIMVGAPEVLLRKDPETGKKQEPYEEVVVEVPAEYQGVVMEEMSKKGGEMKTMEAAAVESSLVFTFSIPTRNLIGMQGRFAQRTSGSAVMTSQFEKWGDYLEGSNRIRDHGAITTTADGKATFYSIHNSQPRGKFFVEPGEEVYSGMVIGIHSKEQDLEINVTKEKATTNVRASGQTAQTIPPKIRMSLDDWLGHMDTDEVLEITPTNLRLCKKNSKSLKVRS